MNGLRLVMEMLEMGMAPHGFEAILEAHRIVKAAQTKARVQAIRARREADAARQYQELLTKLMRDPTRGGL